MQFTTLTAVATLATAAVAAPAGASTASSRTVVGQWLYRGTVLWCSDAQNCTWQLNIDMGNGKVVPCTFRESGKTADVPDVQCGGSTLHVSLGWNSQGFWTMAVKDLANHLISFPAYSTGEIQPNGAAAPDRVFNVESLHL
ncbi:hypothetical protein GQ53DRAFT_743545 [Thozetella sp. PMI_491]|nr:hypothetical protein GQ53DRAFT_743545 [Thozetella sp. PMI_491]